MDRGGDKNAVDGDVRTDFDSAVRDTVAGGGVVVVVVVGTDVGVEEYLGALSVADNE